MQLTAVHTCCVHSCAASWLLPSLWCRLSESPSCGCPQRSGGLLGTYALFIEWWGCVGEQALHGLLTLVGVVL